MPTGSPRQSLGGVERGAATLPLPPTDLVGRTREITAVAALYSEDRARLVTLTGPGGIGKSRLAIEVGRKIAPDFPDGARFVDLSVIADADAVTGAIADGLGFRLSGEPDAIDEIAAALRPRAMLVILDNFEHVLAAAGIVADLLMACPSVAFLVTSRAMLRLSAERVFAVPPLGLPDSAGANHAEPAASDAVRLFAIRARSVKSDFVLDDESAVTVGEISRRLDGLPLAIELAAARSNFLSPVALLTRLENSLDLLTTGPRDRPNRQQTLRGAIAWSYDLLSPSEQSLLRALAVFVGGWTLEAAEAVGGDAVNAAAPPGGSVVDLVGALVDGSLLRQLDAAGGDVRIGMLETVREFALERLTAAGEANRVRDRLLAWITAFVESIESRLAGFDQNRWLKRLDLEAGNIRSALAWAQTDGDPVTGLRLAADLGRYWEARSHLSEGRGYLRRLLDLVPRDPSGVRAKALSVYGRLAELQGDYGEAQQALTGALDAWRELGDQSGEAQALSALGGVLTARGDYDGSEKLNQQALASYRTRNDRAGVARVLLRLGAVSYRRGDVDQAVRHWEEGLELERALGDRYEAGSFLNNLGLIASRRGQLERAQLFLEENLALVREVEDQRGIAIALLNLSQVDHGRGERELATARLHEALALFEEVGDRQGRVTTLNNLGTIAFDRADYGVASAAYEESLAIARQIGDRRSVALGLGNLGGVALSVGDGARAEVVLRESHATYREIGDRAGTAAAAIRLAHVLIDREETTSARELVADSGALESAAESPTEMAATFEVLARLALDQGATERAVRLLGRANAIRADSNAPAEQWEVERRESVRRATQESLGESRFAAACEAGRNLLDEQVLAEALAAAAAPEPAPSDDALPFGLTAREIEVLRLVAEGMPDREIAEALFVSRRTIGGHVTNILNKLGVGSRAAAAAIAVRDGIV